MIRARLVDEYTDLTGNPLDLTETYLKKLFTDTLTYSGSYFFSDIWVPVLETETVNGTRQLKDKPVYYNCGMTPAQISDLYWTEYSGNYLIGRSDTFIEDFYKNETRVRSIFLKNLRKYRKLIELEGLFYNPLYNVDGTEIRQLLENSGTTDIERGSITSNRGVQFDNTTTTHNVSAYDGTTKKEWDQKMEGKGGSDLVPGGIQSVTYSSGDYVVADTSITGGSVSHSDEYTNGTKDNTTFTHNNAMNKEIVDGAEVNAEYKVNAPDTAFGYALIGGDKMHVEKLIRQGNIGVTKSSELVEDQRNSLKFNLIQEFFDDINKVILVGLYGKY